MMLDISHRLILVPTPLDDMTSIEEEVKNLLLRAITLQTRIPPLFIFEEEKNCFSRWVSLWKMPRPQSLPSKIKNSEETEFSLSNDQFHFMNEHNEAEKSNELISYLKKGHTLFLMSDGGLPGFCDPGALLIRDCHRHKIKVTSTPFHNSLILGITLTGLLYNSHQHQFNFKGFIQHKDKVERKVQLKNLLLSEEVGVFLETPYRFFSVLKEIVATMEDELSNIQSQLLLREIGFALNLGRSDEEMWVGTLEELKGYLQDELPSEKRKVEGVIVLGPFKSKTNIKNLNIKKR